jgi:hypothetical protein
MASAPTDPVRPQKDGGRSRDPDGYVLVVYGYPPRATVGGSAPRAHPPSPELVPDTLTSVVRRSGGGVLASTPAEVPDADGLLVSVHRRRGQDGKVGPGLWLRVGSPADRTSYGPGWLRAGRRVPPDRHPACSPATGSPVPHG